MDDTQDCPIVRYQDGEARTTSDTVTTEARIELDINDGRQQLAMLCTPRDLEALAAGFLFGEGVLRRGEDLQSVQVAPDGRRVLVRGEFDGDALEELTSSWTWGTGCGRGGTRHDVNAPARGAVQAGRVVTAEALFDLARQFQAKTDLWRRTGGVHACALASAERIVHFAEDVGRHNAFDKVIGKAVLAGEPLTDKLILTTGRISAEIVAKATACGLGILASRGAVTSLAAALARRSGLTLVGFLRGRRLNVYTGPERIAAEPGKQQEANP